MAVNSAGTLVGAVLESAGYIYQASLLDSLAAPLKEEVGALIYLLGVTIALVQFTVLKSSRMAPWLLIGPAVFFAVILDRSPIPQAKWSFGSNERSVEQVTKHTEAVTEGVSGPANVSTVFRKFVTMTSDVTRSMVDTINGVQIKNDLWFIAKGQLFGSMTNFKEDDVGLQELIHLGLTGYCYEVIQAGKAVTNPLDRLTAAQLGEMPGSVQSAVQKSADYNVETQAAALERYNRLLDLPKYSFANNKVIRKYMEAANAQAVFYKYTLPLIGGVFGGIGGVVTAILGQVLGQVADANINQSGIYSCKDIWGFVLYGIKEQAAVIETDLGKSAKDLGIEKDAINNLLGQASGLAGGQLLSDDTSGAIASQDIARIISKYYLRNVMRSNDTGSRIARFAGNADIRSLSTRLEGDFSNAERQRLGVQEFAEKERLAHAAYSMPVYQGLILYFLGVTFPFFALLLLIPGKASGFFMWFWIWIWAKSWDVAMAIVMQLDTIFWSIYAVQKQKIGENEFIPDDLATAMVALEQMDPTFQMHGYYAMLSVCVLAIPPVTANLILGSMRAGAGIVSQGVNHFSSFFGDNMGGKVQQGAISALKSDAIALQSIRGLAYSLGGSGGGQDLLQGREERGLSPQGAQARSRLAAGYGDQANIADAVRYSNTSRSKHFEQQNLNANAKAHAGLEQIGGEVAPSNIMGRAYGNIPSSLLKLHYSNALTVQTAANKKDFEILQKQAKSEAAQASYEGTVDALAYELHEMIGNLGAIPVPWVTEGDDGSAQEVERHLAEFNLRMGMLKAYADQVSMVVGEGKSTYEGVFGKSQEAQEAVRTNPLANSAFAAAVGFGVSLYDDDVLREYFRPILGTSSGGGVLSEEEFKLRLEEFEAKKPEFLKDYLRKALTTPSMRITPNGVINSHQFIDTTFGGDLNDLVQGSGGGRRALRETSVKKNNRRKNSLYHLDEDDE